MTKKFAIDLIERAASTFGEVFLTLLLASWASITKLGDVVNVGRAAALGGIAAALAVVKGGLASLKGNSNSASLAKSV